MGLSPYKTLSFFGADPWEIASLIQFAIIKLSLFESQCECKFLLVKQQTMGKNIIKNEENKYG